MFVQVYRPREQKALLINVDHVWKIEVSYAVPTNPNYWRTTLEEGKTNPETVRMYEVYVGSEKIVLAGRAGDRVVQVFEEILKNAITN